MADILTTMLSSVPDRYDKTEGSIFYDALAPVAPEIEALGEKADGILASRFLDTAESDDLDRVTTEFGVTRKAAQYASGTVTLTGTAGRTVSAGALVATDAAQYYTSADCTVGSDGTVDVEIVCAVAGTDGNAAIGTVTKFPVTISGITAVTNAAAISGGYEAETDDELRERTYLKIRTPGTSGNKNDYVTWALSVDGVGGAKVTPLWNGNGTVKVVIVNSNGEAADTALVSAVTAYIETVRPVGASVTVASATTTTINVTVSVTLSSGYVRTAVDAAITAAITAYLRTFRLSGTTVSYAKIGAIIMAVDGVSDYSSLTVNNGTANVAITAGAVPVLGTVTDSGT